MALYEHIFLARQDVSQQQVEELTTALTEILSQGGGKVTKNEYWGLKGLSYRIRKNRKAHYTLLNIDASAPAVAEMERTASICAREAGSRMATPIAYSLGSIGVSSRRAVDLPP